MSSQDFQLIESLEQAWRSTGGAIGEIPDWRDFVGLASSEDLLYYILEMDIEQRVLRGLPGILEQRYWEHPKVSGRWSDSQKIDLIKTEVRSLGKRQRSFKAKQASGLSHEPSQSLSSGYANAFPELVSHANWSTIPWEVALSSNLRGETGENHAEKKGKAQEELQLGEWIGPYQLLQRLGQGGMGEVWMAEQKAPVKRTVALKLIKDSASGSHQILARFDAERQALSLMNHPNIATILDAGETKSGVPYFVMELVPGQPITEYCDQHNLSIEERLKLFCDVCSGVQHAHQKGIIHRDLKPSNILVCEVDGQGFAKVIDFGLAKAINSGQRLTDQSLFTKVGQIIGTLKYMSPEQASLDSVDIDTRTDIYALGVILYELLTGCTPLDEESLKGQAVLRLLELIQKHEPPRPSSKMSNSKSEATSAISARRRIATGRLERILAGDLDWIVMRALEKDRARRYESASGLAADVNRYLLGEPVVARPPSVSYRFKKFVKKHRTAVTAASLIGLAIFVAVIGTSWGLIRARQAEKVADRRRTEIELALKRETEALAGEKQERGYAEAISAFVIEDLLAMTSVEGQIRFGGEGLDKDTSLGELLDRAAEKLRQRQDLDPKIRGKLYHIIGINYRGSSQPEKGIPILREAVDNYRIAFGENSADGIKALNSLAVCLSAAGKYDSAIETFEKTLKSMTESLEDTDPAILGCMINLAGAYQDAGRTKDAIPLLEKTYHLQKDSGRPVDKETILCMKNLALAYAECGDIQKAVPFLEQTLELANKSFGASNILTVLVENELAGLYIDTDNLDRAIEIYEHGLEFMETKFGKDHQNTINQMINLASAYRDAGNLVLGRSLGENAVELSRKNLGPVHPDTLVGLNNLGLTLVDAGEPEKAIPLFRETLMARQKQLGPEHPNTLNTMNNLAGALKACGEVKEAIQFYEQVLELFRARYPANDPRILTVMGNLAGTYLNDNRQEKAVLMLEQVLQDRKLVQSPQHPDTLITMSKLSQAYQAAGRLTDAITLAEQALKLMETTLRHEHPHTLVAAHHLAELYLQSNDPVKCIPLIEQTLELRQKTLGRDNSASINSMSLLAIAYRQFGRLEKVIALEEEMLTILKAQPEQNKASIINCMEDLAANYNNANNLDRTISVLQELVVLMKANLGEKNDRTVMALANLSVVLKRSGKIKEARPILEQAYEAGKYRPELADLRNHLREVYLLLRDFAGFEGLAEEDLQIAREKLADRPVELASVLVSIGKDYLTLERFDRASALLKEGYEIRSRTQPDTWNTFNALSLLGQALLRQEKVGEAESALVISYEGLAARAATIPPEAGQPICDALERIVALYQKLGKTDQQKKYEDLLADMKRTTVDK